MEANIEMNDDHPKRDNMSLEEATISNMWEIAAIVEVLERKGLCTKQDLYRHTFPINCSFTDRDSPPDNL